MTTAHVVLPNNGGRVNGGGKVMIRMAESLQELGYDVTLQFSNGAPPRWLDIVVPVVPRASADLVIVCEVSFGWINRVKGANYVYYQSPTYIERDRNLRAISYREQGAAGVVFNSEWNRTRYLEAVGEDGPIVHPTVDVTLFQPSGAADPTRGVYFPRKNYGLVVRVLRELERRGVDVDWLMADEIPEGRLAEQWRARGISMITGYPESFPMPPLEAMASGSVPVGTAGGAGLEYMVDGENSLVVADGDWEALADAIERISTDVAFWQKLRENGIRTARTYTRERQKRELAKALAELGAPVPSSASG